MELTFEEEKKQLITGSNRANIYNLVQLLIFIWSKSKMKF